VALAKEAEMTRCCGFVMLGLLGFGCLGFLSDGQAQTPSPAQQYRLGNGDVLQLNVLQRPDLDGPLRIRPDGAAVIARVGAVALGGLTIMEAEELVRQRLQLFDPNLTNISLTITEYNALRIYVLGAVTNPGLYTFSTPPTLWDALKAAGGPAVLANLAVVRLVSQHGGQTKSETYDLSSIITGEGAVPNVLLQTEDTVVVPTVEGGFQVPSDTGVQVMGAVGAPSIVPIQEPTRLLTVLMKSGTPLETGMLNKIWWVHREGPMEYRSTKVNAKLFLEEGSLAGNPLVYPGDTVRLPEDKPGWFGMALPTFLSIATASATIIIAADRLKN
jgi:protein involved in polysaccharide export with SLBB domain